jgi:hypothetical protein
MSSQPFRFLELPTELRFMVYEQISPTSHTHILNTYDDGVPVRTSFTCQSLPVSLLSTSRQIAYEAQPFFAAKFATLKNQSMRFDVTDAPSGTNLVQEYGRLIKGSGIFIDKDFFQDLRKYREFAAAEGEVTEVAYCDAQERMQRARVAAIEARVTAQEKVFSEHSSTMLAWVSEVRLTPEHCFDVEIRLEKDISECTVQEISHLLFSVDEFCECGFLAVVIVGTGLEDANVARPGHTTASDTWRRVQAQAAAHYTLGERPCLRLVDLPASETGE